MRRSARGFTLVELLVAVAIFAVIGIAAASGLRSVIRLRDQNDQTMHRLRQVQLAMAILARDFSQLAPRPIRDELGSERPALAAGPDNVPPIEFTHGGWPNPLGLARSTQQRVAYTLEDGKLMRYTWPMLDRSVQVDPLKQELLPDVTAMDVEYLDPSGGDFQNVWPPINVGAASSASKPPSDLLPRAVSIKLTLKDWGEVTRIVEVGP